MPPVIMNESKFQRFQGFYSPHNKTYSKIQNNKRNIKYREGGEDEQLEAELIKIRRIKQASQRTVWYGTTIWNMK